VVFRYLFFIAFLLLMACEFIRQTPALNAFSFVSAAVLVSSIFLAAFVISVLRYRKHESNVSFSKAIQFYFTCKCCKSKLILDNYE
jgi:hypothetical protein